MSFDLFSLRGQNVLITGATRGIGAGCAIALAQAGASVCLVQRNDSDKRTLDALPVHDDGRAHKILICDLSDLSAVRGLFDKALETMGGEIHIMVNCAGIQRRHPAVDFPESDWDEVLNLNLKVVWMLSQAAGRHMVPLRRGKVINMASLMSYQGGITVPAYTASKGAVGQLIKALSNEWAQHNVQVNGIVPGYIDTDMNTNLINDPLRSQQIGVRIPAGRWGKPEDFAGPIVFLASAASNYVSGELLVVDGGWMGR